VPRLPLLPRELDESSEREDEPLIPSLERPDEPLMPESWFALRDDEAEPELRLERSPPDDEPFAEALRPPWPERFCDWPRPELVLPEAPSPSLRLLLSPTLLELRSLLPALRSLELLDPPALPLRLLDAP
jgi:hypothetical protein